MDMLTQETRSGVLTLRPNIPTIDFAAATSDAEQFQNETLRPLLKFQHPLLVAVFETYAQSRKKTLSQMPDHSRSVFIEESLHKDHQLRQLFMGMLIGHFTLTEYSNYLACEKEIRKRAIEMLIQRLQDQLG